MVNRIAAVALLLCMQSQFAFAEIARHETLEIDQYGNPENISIVYADENGNLRMEIYGVDASATASAAAGSDAEVDYSRGALQGLMVYQAAEEQMVVVDQGQCQTLSADMSGMPGMPPGGMDEYREEMAAAQQEMEQMMRELAEEDPAMARMLEERMASMGGMPGMPGMQQQRPEMIVEETGDDRSIGDYETTGFLVYEEGTNRHRTSVWAADIDDVVGGRIVGSAMKGWLELFRDIMDRMGAGRGSGLAGAVLDKMDDYYPIVTEGTDHRTTLISAEIGASAEFYPDCG